MSRFRLGPASVLFLVAGVLVGCGQDDPCECLCPALGTGGVLPEATGGTGGGGGAGGAENPYQLTANKWGSVRFYNFQFGGAMYMQVSFSDTPQVLHPTCQIDSNENCDVRRCPITETVNPAVVPDAGAIYITSGQVTGQALLQPDVNGIYSSDQGSYLFGGDPAFYFTGGEPLTISAAGGEVPVFEVATTYPQAVSVVDPPGVDGTITADPTLGLTLTLSGGAEGDELFVFGRVTNEAAALETTMVCTFPTVAATAVLTPEQLALLPDGFPLTVDKMRREVVTAGEYEVTVRLLGEVADAAATNPVSILVQAPVTTPEPTP